MEDRRWGSHRKGMCGLWKRWLDSPHQDWVGYPRPSWLWKLRQGHITQNSSYAVVLE